MRKTLVTLALAASGLAAAACTAQSTPQPGPQTAAQANADILAQARVAPSPGAIHLRGMRGGHGGGGMTRADTDGDGLVTRVEAIAQADERFAAMDTNHDGQLSADEMQAARAMMRDRMEAHGATPPPPPPGGAKHMPGMGRHADPDGNGMIARAEFEARAGTRFDRMDANHDGKLDKTELATMAAMRRGPRGGMDDAPPPPPPGE